METTYSIFRYYAPHLNKSKELIESGLSLEEAQAHCQRPDTKGDGWFDGYSED